MQGDDLNYELLCKIEELESTSQRDLAERLGVSVGKVNFCLRAIIDKGWVKVNNFKRADNKWAYTYLLTPSGALAQMKLARNFLDRKEREFELLQAEIFALRARIGKRTPDNEQSNISS